MWNFVGNLICRCIMSLYVSLFISNSLPSAKIDYLSRNIAAASSQQLLDQMIPHIKTIRLPRD